MVKVHRYVMTVTMGYGDAILMDLSKAFDTLNHDLLIAKLHAYGFDIKTLKLLHNYLTKKWQRTKVNSSFTAWSELLHKVSLRVLLLGYSFRYLLG